MHMIYNILNNALTSPDLGLKNADSYTLTGMLCTNK